MTRGLKRIAFTASLSVFRQASDDDLNLPHVRLPAQETEGSIRQKKLVDKMAVGFRMFGLFSATTVPVWNSVACSVNGILLRKSVSLGLNSSANRAYCFQSTFCSRLLSRQRKPLFNIGHQIKKSSNGKAVAESGAKQNTSAKKRAVPKTSDILRLISLAKPEKMRLFGKLFLTTFTLNVSCHSLLSKKLS